MQAIMFWSNRAIVWDTNAIKMAIKMEMAASYLYKHPFWELLVAVLYNCPGNNYAILDFLLIVSTD